MNTAAKSKFYDYFLLVMFIAMLFILLFFVATGTAWNLILPDTAFLWIAVLVAFLATVAGAVFLYSLVHYMQLPTLRSLIIMFLGVNVVILAFLFLVTHPSALDSAYAGRERNRTIVSALGFLLTPGVLAGSIFGGREVTRRNRNPVILWGALLQPLFSASLLLTEDAMFSVTTPTGGLVGLTLIGWILTIVVGSTASVSLIRYAIEWIATKDRIIMASTLALVLWIYSFIIYSVLEDPLQVAELMWIGGIIAGFLMLCGGMIFTAIIEPHRGLEVLVDTRTAELNMAKRESDLYLTMWTHKMGNFLQAILAYLEILRDESLTEEGYQRATETAMTLTKEITVFNRQVATLSEIKSSKKKKLVPYRLKSALEKARATSRQMLPTAKFRIMIDEPRDEILVMADGKLDIAFTNLFTNEILSREGQIDIFVTPVESDSNVRIQIKSNGSKPTGLELEQLMTDVVPNVNTLNLNLFNIRLLLKRYNGSIQYRMDEDSEKNVYTIILKNGKSN
ncbi:HAMP domain-containing histidine kinase [Candidatus Thorarchaeota archaeon]|nr:MAG: HAMP domain-containing histidine kinase [Candidatus Thorarchaeota archaeon]